MPPSSSQPFSGDESSVTMSATWARASKASAPRRPSSERKSLAQSAGTAPRDADFDSGPHVAQTTWAGLSADIVAAAQGHVPILVDGGIRRGTEIVTALCLGASAVLIGRPIIWGLSTYGAAGVAHAIDILRTELEMAMALLGAADVAALNPDLL